MNYKAVISVKIFKPRVYFSVVPQSGLTETNNAK